MSGRLLITGASGGVGVPLVRALLERGQDLTLVLRGEAEERAAALFPRAGSRLRAVAGDVTRPGLALDPAALRGLSGVVHLAARTDFAGRSVEDYRAQNVDGARHAAEVALAARVPLWHVSTAYVAGDHQGELREDQLDLGQGFKNGYERSKFEAERALLDLTPHGLRLVRLRLGVALPEEPIPGVPPGPGPLHYLRLLAALKPPAGAATRLRTAGDPAATLSVVPSAWAAQVIAGLLERRPDQLAPCYHLTAARPLSMQELLQALHRAIPAVRLEPAPRGGPTDPDPLERLVARRCAVYAPYQFQTTRWDRSRLEADLGPLAQDGAGPAWLDRVFAAHLRTWSGQAPAQPEPAEAGEIRAYFGPFLAAKLGRALIPGLATLSRAFSISVPGLGTWALSIEAGRLTRVAPVSAPAALDYELPPGPLLRVVRGELSPQTVFFAREVRISGPTHEALALATALGEFFRRYPFAGAAVPSAPIARTA